MPYSLVFRRYAPFDTFGGGFHGDGRGKASFSGSARTTATVPFDRNGLVGLAYGESSGTLHPTTGAKEYMSPVDVKVSNLKADSGTISFTAHSKGANPHPIALDKFGVAPAIDTYIDFIAEFDDTNLKLSGVVRGDNFPNAEVFLVPPNYRIVLLDHYETTGGRNTGPLTRLWGENAGELLTQFRSVIKI